VPSEGELAWLMDRSPIGMYRSDDRGRLLFVNPALVAMLGYDSADEVLALDLERDVYLKPGARGPVLEEYRERGVVDGMQVEWKTRAGKPLLVQLCGHVVESREGRLTFDATVFDLTEIEAIERALRDERAELARARTTLDLLYVNAPAIYWRVDKDQHIVTSGGATHEMFGYGGGRFDGMTIAEQYRTAGPTIDSTEHHARALRGEIVSFDSEYLGKQLSCSVGPVRDESGAIVGAIGTAIDVTRARELERRMIDAQRAESLGVLAGGLAHDFNNLLVAVLGNADLALREVPTGAHGRVAIESIRDAALRACELTDQLLAYAGRGGAGTSRVVVAPVIDELLRILAPSLPERVRVATDVEPNIALRGDPAQLRQVVLNLVGNARDALGAHGGSIGLRASVIAHDGAADPDDVLACAPGSYVLLEVSDDGPGLDRELRRRVFDPFFTTKSSGHGLGLAAVLGIVRAHGGGLRITTAPGEGATFRILWPVAPARTKPSTPPPPTPTRTVLVVDDEDLVRDVVGRMVEDLGYAAITVADGPAALAVLDQRAVDLVLVDMTMPRMSGADVVAAVRSKKPAMPVVVCSGFDRDGRGRVDADAYLAKPFRIDALEKTLAKLFA
jgi:PAS domain S-box-containing protein